MGMKASEVGNWLRQDAGRRNHHEALRGDYVVLRPGGAVVVGSLGCALTRLGQDEREQPRALLAASPSHRSGINQVLSLALRLRGWGPYG